MIGGFHAKAIEAMNGGELGGVADKLPDRAKDFAEENNIRAYESV